MQQTHAEQKLYIHSERLVLVKHQTFGQKRLMER